MVVDKLLDRASYDALAVAVACGFLVAPWSRHAARVIGQVVFYPRGADVITRNTLVMSALLAAPIDSRTPPRTFSAPGYSGDAAWRRRVMRARYSLLASARGADSGAQ